MKTYLFVNMLFFTKIQLHNQRTNHNTISNQIIIQKYSKRMKLFDFKQVLPKPAKYLKLTQQATTMIIEIAKILQISLPALHTALWVFHCNAIVMTYHNMDRYIYACGALLVGTKIMECLRDPLMIVEHCRKILRARKDIKDEDTREILVVEAKKVFEAEVNIMINIGFDFGIVLASQVANQYQISSYLGDHLTNKFKQALTSLYKTEVVILFSPIMIVCLALDIILKSQGKNIQLVEINEEIRAILQSPEIKEVKKQYLERCGMI